MNEDKGKYPDDFAFIKRLIPQKLMESCYTIGHV